MLGILDAATYAYSYGMVSALPQHLDEETYARLISAIDVDAVIAELMKTHYEQKIKEVISKGNGKILENIEKAITSHYFDICNAVINTLPGDVRNSAKSLLLDEFDIGNLKRILRGIKAKKNVDEILAECIEGNIKDEILKEIAGAEFKSAIDKIRNLGIEIEGENLFDVENSMDLYLIRKWKKEAEHVKVIEKFVKHRIDMLNLKAIIRTKILNIDAGNFIKNTVEGMYLNFEILNKINSLQINKENVDQILGVLTQTPYEDLFATVFERFKKTKNLDVFESEIELASASYGVIQNPISLEYIITYLRRMWFDVRNIRVILVEKNYGMKEDEIRKSVILI